MRTETREPVMRSSIFVSICFSALLVAIAGCTPRSAPKPVVPDQLTLYSIDGRDFPPGQKPKSDETFHDYPVLGKVDVKSAEARRVLMAALQDGLAQSDGTMAHCFWPRHALRIVEKGRTIDYVICFQCLQVMVFDGNSSETKPTTPPVKACLTNT